MKKAAWTFPGKAGRLYHWSSEFCAGRAMVGMRKAQRGATSRWGERDSRPKWKGRGRATLTRGAELSGWRG